MSLLVVGTVAFDAIETPFGKTDKIVGGAASYIALAASYYTKNIHLVSVVGDDFPQEFLNTLKGQGVDLEGLQIKKGEKSFLPPDELQDCATVGKIKVSNRRWRLYRPACKEGVVLYGDAAGILDPAAGQGIFNALWSGNVAAQAVVSCLRQPELEAIHLARYDEWFMEQYEEKVEKLRSYYEEHGIFQ